MHAVFELTFKSGDLGTGALQVGIGLVSLGSDLPLFLPHVDSHLMVSDEFFIKIFVRITVAQHYQTALKIPE